MILFKLSSLLVLLSYGSNFASIARAITQIDYKLVREEFTCLKLNTSLLFGRTSYNTSRLENSRFTYMVMPTDEPSLPNNWNYLVSEDQSLIFFFGYPLVEDSLMDLEIVQFDEYMFTSSKAKVRINFNQDISGNMNVTNSEQDELKLDFNHINLEKFLAKDYPSKVQSIFSTFIWPKSRLVFVKNSSNHSGVSVIIRNSRIGSSLDRLSMEIDRATRGKQRKLCEFRKSKVISIEHHFRSIGLYPDWCSFKLILKVGPVLFE